MKKLWATIKRTSDETLDGVENQLRDKVEDLNFEFEY